MVVLRSKREAGVGVRSGGRSSHRGPDGARHARHPLRDLASGSTALFLLAALAGAWGCASEEIPRYGDPQRVGGGQGGATTGTTTSSAGGACETDSTCGVSFKDDIFPVFDQKAKCAFVPGCHGDGKGGLTLTEGDVASYFDALTAFKLKDGSSNIVPCDPASSKLLCNLKVSSGTNPHGTCGTQLMPPNPANAPTPDDLTNIEDWITCGSPNN